MGYLFITKITLQGVHPGWGQRTGIFQSFIPQYLVSNVSWTSARP